MNSSIKTHEKHVIFGLGFDTSSNRCHFFTFTPHMPRKTNLSSWWQYFHLLFLGHGHKEAVRTYFSHKLTLLSLDFLDLCTPC